MLAQEQHGYITETTRRYNQTVFEKENPIDMAKQINVIDVSNQWSAFNQRLSSLTGDEFSEQERLQLFKVVTELCVLFARDIVETKTVEDGLHGFTTQMLYEEFNNPATTITPKGISFEECLDLSELADELGLHRLIDLSMYNEALYTPARWVCGNNTITLHVAEF